VPPSPVFASKLHEQIANEFAAEHEYIACAVHYDSEALPELARFFYRQALEERGHALMMVQFLLDTGAGVMLPGIDAPTSSFADAVEPIALALEQERRVAEQINALAAVAREENDYVSEQFIQWFIREQIEEVATMSNLLRVAQRSLDDLPAIEDYIVREHQGDAGEDPTAPRAAGSA
jgi:bacterioferritin B